MAQSVLCIVLFCIVCQDTYDMQWSYSGDVLLTTDAVQTLRLLDLR